MMIKEEKCKSCGDYNKLIGILKEHGNAKEFDGYKCLRCICEDKDAGYQQTQPTP